MSQVHKENLTAVDNALPNRAGLDIEIFGMEGIPEDIVQQHTQRVLQTYHQAQAERQAATGNSAQGASGPKKLKTESASDLKSRLAAHKAAKLAAEQGDGSQSGGGTPQPSAPAQLSPANGHVSHPISLTYQIILIITTRLHPRRIPHTPNSPMLHLLPMVHSLSLHCILLHRLPLVLHHSKDMANRRNRHMHLRRQHNRISLSPTISPHRQPFSNKPKARIRLNLPSHNRHIKLNRHIHLNPTNRTVTMLLALLVRDPLVQLHLSTSFRNTIPRRPSTHHFLSQLLQVL
jgi:hypothetical protein